MKDVEKTGQDLQKGAFICLSEAVFVGPLCLRRLCWVAVMENYRTLKSTVNSKRFRV